MPPRTDRPVCGCGRPTTGATLCRACSAELGQWLAQVPSLTEDLVVTMTRQARVNTGQPGAKRQEQPLPYDVGASDALRALHGVLVAWVPVVVPAGRTAALALGPDHTAGLSRLLAVHLVAAAQHPDADLLHAEVHAAVLAATKAVDLPEHVVWVGVCRQPLADVHGDPAAPCTGDLYCHPAELTVRCRVCGVEHDARERRYVLLAAAREHLLSASQVTRALLAYGVKATPSVVRNLAARGQLTPAGEDITGHPTYRVGDVLDRLHERSRRVTA